MKTSVLLRLASILTFFYFAGHTLGFPWTPVVGEPETAILESMKSHRFNVMANMRSYWDFYVGFGLVVSGFMLAVAIVLWQLAALEKKGVAGLRPVILTFFIAFAINAGIDVLYFFVIPVTVAVAIAICLGLAFVTSLRSEKNPRSLPPGER